MNLRLVRSLVPDACTLPTAELPLRLAEFDDLFATAVPQVDPISATHSRLHLTGPAGLAARVRDLAARETDCCSFFTFTTTGEPAGDGEAVVLDIEVPAAHGGEDVARRLRRPGRPGAGNVVAAPAPSRPARRSVRGWLRMRRQRMRLLNGARVRHPQGAAPGQCGGICR